MCISEIRKRRYRDIRYNLLLLIIIILSPAAIAASDNQLKRFAFSEQHMGTTFRIILYAPDRKVALESSKAAFAKIAELNQVLSSYLEDSEISKLNNISAGDTFDLSNELYDIIKKSVDYSKKTNGAFDITVGPFVDLWTKAREKQEIPSKKEIENIKSSVGYKKLGLIPSKEAVVFKAKGMKLDVGGIGKGFAIDRAMKVLNDYGISRALIDGGGDILLGEPPPGKEGWRIQLGLFEHQNGKYQNMVTLSNRAIASSGDLYQYVEYEGKRYSHIVNPKTGVGLTNQLRVTILAPNGTMADALASAVSVMGVKKGLKMVKKINRVEGLIFSEKGDEIKYWQTQPFLQKEEN